MRSLRRFATRLWGVFHAAAIDREIDEELESHLSLHMDDNIRHGMSEDEARAEALRRLGDILQTKNLYRRQAIFPTLLRRLQEFLYSLTELKRSALFTTTLFVSLTLAVGFATSAIGLLYNTVLSPYPYRDASGMLHLIVRDQTGHLVWPLYSEDEFRKVVNSPAVQSAIAYRNREFKCQAIDHDFQAMGTELSANAFAYLGVPSLLGRGIETDDFHADSSSAPVVVVGYQLWRSNFASNPHILGKSLMMSGRSYRIVGVAAPRFTWGDGELFVPMEQADDPSHRMEINLRLVSGISHDEADKMLGFLLEQFARSDPNRFPPDFTPALSHLNVPFSKHNRPELMTLCGTAGCLTLFAIVNACLLAAYRARLHHSDLNGPYFVEHSDASPLGYVLTESGLLAGTSCIAGLAIAALLTPLLHSFLPRYAVPSEAQSQLGTSGLCIALCFGLCCWSLLASASGGLYLCTLSLDMAMRNHAVSLKKLLVALQITSGGLLLFVFTAAVHGYFEARARPLGYSPEDVYVVSLPIDQSRYSTWQQHTMFYRALLHALQSQFKDATFALSSHAVPPNGGLSTTARLSRSRWPTEISVSSHFVSSDFFSALHVSLVEGSMWGSDADSLGQGVVVINKTLKQKEFGTGSALNKTIMITLPSYLQYSLSSPSARRSFRVVGVVDDFQNDSLEKPVAPSVYVPFTILLDGHLALLVHLPHSRKLLPAVENQLSILDASFAGTPRLESLASIRKSILAHNPIELLPLTSGILILCFSFVGGLAFVTRRRLESSELLRKAVPEIAQPDTPYSVVIRF